MPSENNIRAKRATCHPEKPHAAFGLCHACYFKERKIRDPEFKERQRRLSKESKLRTLYGLTSQAYKELQRGQNNECAVCFVYYPDGSGLAVDHCHSTGTVRGLLCDSCNKGLGMFRENLDALKGAMNYLSRSKK